MNYDVAVVGAGTVGMAAALALAAEGRSVSLIGPVAASQPGRTTALLQDAIRVLGTIGAWTNCAQLATPLRTMRILDGTRRLVRARPIEFDAREIGQEEFGFNIENDDLNAALRQSLSNAGVAVLEATVDQLNTGEDHVELRTGTGVLTAKLIVGADGRNSVTRESVEITARRWTYDQTALTCTFTHERPHEERSIEIHTETGPFTQVPLPSREGRPNRSSLVWVEKPTGAAALRSRSLDEFSKLIEARLGHVLGSVEVEHEPSAYPLGGLSVSRYATSRVALVGEAAHVFPPIGAQGANLGFRDITGLVDATKSHADPGASAATSAYDRQRRADTMTRTTAVDLLNRSLLTDALAIQAGRVATTGLLRRAPFIRRALMQFGMAPSRLMGTDRQVASRS